MINLLRFHLTQKFGKVLKINKKLTQEFDATALATCSYVWQK